MVISETMVPGRADKISGSEKITQIPAELNVAGGN